MKKISTLHEAFIVKLNALYDIESELIRALPVMIEAATEPELKKAFSDHLTETEMQARRLEAVFSGIEEKPKKMKVEAIRGLIEDSRWLIEQEAEAEVLDSQLIAAASYVEHYEIAGYTTAIRWASKLGFVEAGELLEETLEEEKMSAEKLEEMAEETVDDKALESATIEEQEAELLS